jgi:hypothetical protein
VFLRDLGAHQLRDLSQPERVAQLCGPGLPFEFGPLRSLNRALTNLPLQVTSFVGRAGGLAETTLLLADRRHVTLAGAGGCGKTRLAVQLGAEVLDDFPDGVWFADLAPLTDPDLVGRTLATAAGVTEVPGQPILDTLADRFTDSVALVVLDNCEHLLDGAAAVAERLLAGCVGVRYWPRAGNRSGPSARRLIESRRWAGRPARTAPGVNRWRCSSTARHWPGRRCGSALTNSPRSPRSARGWTGSRWRSSWPPLVVDR